MAGFFSKHIDSDHAKTSSDEAGTAPKEAVPEFQPGTMLKFVLRNGIRLTKDAEYYRLDATAPGGVSGLDSSVNYPTEQRALQALIKIMQDHKIL